eukprot:m.32370 g.32370  ORF g.32370 m.32370 type:complete len:379 (-) comp9777_c0_seq5:752-1888(-)
MFGRVLRRNGVGIFKLGGAMRHAFRRSISSATEISAAPSTLPCFTLRTGDKIPSIGMGTFTGTRLTQQAQPGDMYKNVVRWIRLGGRMIDCAQNYLNEDEIGDAIADCIAEGIVTREELFISTKLNNPYHRKEHVQPALEKSLLDLRVDYVDLFLMHWPTAFKYVPFDAAQRGFPMDYEPDQCSKVTGVLWQDYKGEWPPPHLDMEVTIHETYEAIVECHSKGLTKHIGVCNFQLQLLHELMCGNSFIPHVLQNESHPYLQQWDQLEFCKKNNIQFMAYSPLGYGAFAGDDRPRVLTNPVIKEVADKHNKSTAQVCLQWCVQRGVNTMPFSLKENELRENLSVGTWSLDDEDVYKMASLDEGFHYLNPKEWYGLPLWN